MGQNANEKSQELLSLMEQLGVDEDDVQGFVAEHWDQQAPDLAPDGVPVMEAPPQRYQADIGDAQFVNDVSGQGFEPQPIVDIGEAQFVNDVSGQGFQPQPIVDIGEARIYPKVEIGQAQIRGQETPENAMVMPKRGTGPEPIFPTIEAVEANPGPLATMLGIPGRRGR